jgi:nicotinamidase/pyrazinamidase
MKVHLLIIDPQNDFLDTPGHFGSLPVLGGYQDMLRMANFIKRAGPKLDDIHVTMDTHRLLDVAHPGWWRAVDSTKASGVDMRVMPTPGTQIKPDDIGPGKKWMPVVPQMLPRMQQYLKELKTQGKYDHTIWSPHTLIGTWGHNIEEHLAAVLLEWEQQNIAAVDYVTKGSNPYTEHFSAIKAEVPDPSDPSTMLNTRLIKTLQESDLIYIGGEAGSHCLKSTVEDIADNFGDENVKKMCLLEDCTSPVVIKDPNGNVILDFTPDMQKFIVNMKKRGMQVAKSTEVMQ